MCKSRGAWFSPMLAATTKGSPLFGVHAVSSHCCRFVSSLGDCCYLYRDFESALEAYRSLIDPPPFFRLNEAACLAQLGRIEEAKQAASELPADFDAALYARITAEICSLKEDADLWADGLRDAGVAV